MDLQTGKGLFVFALESEAAGHFTDASIVYTGIGKLNAGYHLLKAIYKQRPDYIINLGSAGSNIFQRGQVICCTQFVQRDMDVRPLGFEQYETPFCKDEMILTNGLSVGKLPEGICGTGDNFETNHNNDSYNVVDMEAYALALVAQREQIPFICLKYISDGADGGAADEWSVMVHKAAEALQAALNGLKY